tara:strand:- start:1659 stop:2165 length:507 start_codon:yes stop_codon:yes gene_type:complete
MNLITFLKKNKNTRKIFGVRELKIIEKQLLGINLTQSEKNRLSRDIRKKFEFINDLSNRTFDLKLKKGTINQEMVDEALEVILNDKLRKEIDRVLLFGSMVQNQMTVRSDIDIAVKFKKINLKEATLFRIRVSGRVNDKVDVQVLNILPEKIKTSIKNNHRVLYENQR